MLRNAVDEWLNVCMLNRCIEITEIVLPIPCLQSYTHVPHLSTLYVYVYTIFTLKISTCIFRSLYLFLSAKQM